MNNNILQEAGLTATQATAYIILVKNSPCTPPHLAELIKESRTNTYKVLEQLELIGLVSRDETHKKLRYWANNPSLLIDSIKKRRQVAEEAEKRFRDSLPSLMSEYFDATERPGVRFFQAKEGIETMYQDQLETNQSIMMIRTPADLKFFGGFEGIANIRRKFNASTINRHMFTPDTKEARVDWSEHDKQNGNHRTWLHDGDYTAPVEWAVYGNKVAITSFEEEAVGMIIESPQIAEAFRQILKLMDTGSRSKVGYDALPHRARKITRD
jgi:sugar-specific transcriptional regulator TrmB